jgi:peroxiredoxin Q/BCP
MRDNRETGSYKSGTIIQQNSCFAYNAPLSGEVLMAAKTKPVAKKPAKKAVKKPVRQAARKVAGKTVSSETPVMVLKAGDVAPAFSVQNQDGKPVQLANFKGKWVVLYFYPRAMTPGCTVQACGIRDHAAEFRKANAVVLGVSPDKVPALVKFRERDKLDFDLLSDADKSLAKRYGVWGLKKFMGREFMGVRRWTFIIGKDGKVKHILDKVNTKTHHDDVLALLPSSK